MADSLFIRDLRVKCVIGIFDWERKIRQPVNISLEFPYDSRRAAETDDIRDALDYKSVSKEVTAFVAASRFQLIETLAEKIAELCLSKRRVNWVRVRLDKPGALRGARTVGLEITRSAQAAAKSRKSGKKS